MIFISVYLIILIKYYIDQNFKGISHSLPLNILQFYACILRPPCAKLIYSVQTRFAPKKLPTTRGDTQRTEDCTAITSPIINTTNCPSKCGLKALRNLNNMAYKFCAKLSTLAGGGSHPRCNNSSRGNT